MPTATVTRSIVVVIASLFFSKAFAEEWYLPYSPPCTEREKVFEFTEKPAVKSLGNDKYEISFGVKGFCDATVSMVDTHGAVVRHVASGVLGRNAPPPFQKNSLAQKIYWTGKDDLDVYVKEPEKLRVRVALGLKPTFERLIGWHPENLVGGYRGIAADEKGVYVLAGANPQLRKYDRDGRYLCTVFPPAANMPVEKFKGLESLEYEPGKRALHSYVGHSGTPGGLPHHAGFASSVSASGVYWPGGAVSPQQVCLVDGFFTYATVAEKTERVWVYRLRTADGSSDDQSIAWRALSRTEGRGKYSRNDYYDGGEFGRARLKLAVSPDGRWVYVSGLAIGNGYGGVYRMDARTRERMGKTSWMGEDGKPGNDNRHFGCPAGIDCDAQGRVYICDTVNNRIQVYSEAAEHLKTINIGRPDVVRAHLKTGALYVVHADRVQGRSRMLLTRIESFDRPEKTAQYDLGETEGGDWFPMMTLDPYGPNVRLWLTRGPAHLVILEDRGKTFEVVRDFQEDARKTGVPHHVIIESERFGKVSCDAVREKLYVRNYHRFDLKTGAYEGSVGFPSSTDDIAFDKKGRVHVHFNPGFYMPGVARLDPSQSTEKQGASIYPEMPYDYGIEKMGPWHQPWTGILPVKDQPGAKFFQDGIGANMRGDVVVDSNIYYVPRMEDSVAETFVNMRVGVGGAGDHSYEGFIRQVQDMQKRGEEVYFVNRAPGRRLSGGTIWVYDFSGEVRNANMVPGTPLVNGVGLDEAGAVYFVMASTKMVNGRTFLAGRGEVIGTGAKTFYPFTGTLVKFPPSGGAVRSRQASIAMEPWPDRPADLAGCGWGWNSTTDTPWVQGKGGDWLEGAEWAYAGGCPIVPLSCSCPNMRIYTDWYKRTFVPEAYRHSVGIVDTAGNLVMHVGTYGNADSGRGPDSPIKVGGDEIAMAHVMYVAATDNYICLSDSGNERVIVLKLGYHAEESAPIVQNPR